MFPILKNKKDIENMKKKGEKFKIIREVKIKGEIFYEIKYENSILL